MTDQRQDGGGLNIGGNVGGDVAGGDMDKSSKREENTNSGNVTSGMTPAKKGIIATVIGLLLSLGTFVLEHQGLINLIKGFGKEPAAEATTAEPAD